MMVLSLKTGSLAALHGCLFQGLTAALIASGYSLRRTQIITGLSQMGLALALSLRETPSFMPLLWPFIAGKTVAAVMQSYPRTRRRAASAGFMVSFLMMVWQHGTPAGMWMLGVTLVCSQGAERLTRAAAPYLFPVNHQSLDAELLHGKIASLQRECQRTQLMLQAARPAFPA